MRIIAQRVNQAKVIVNDEIVSQIEKGLLLLLAVTDDDNQEDIDWMAHKIVNLRIFNDAYGKMNLNIRAISGQILVISQFTLYASTKKGNRPSFLRSSKPEYAKEVYEKFIDKLKIPGLEILKRG